MKPPPLPEEYGRVTNPERFRRLWTDADGLLSRLATEYRVAWEENLDLDRELSTNVTGGISRVVRLQPDSADSAPMVFAFTGFPGLRVRFGRWHVESFPVCGCDACAEDPEELAAALTERVEMLVGGAFAESVSLMHRPGISYTFGSGVGWSSLSRADAMRLGAPKTINWTAWQRAT